MQIVTYMFRTVANQGDCKALLLNQFFIADYKIQNVNMMIKAIYFDNFTGEHNYYMVTLKHLEAFKEEDLTASANSEGDLDGMMGKLLQGLMGGGSGGIESLLGQG